VVVYFECITETLASKGGELNFSKGSLLHTISQSVSQSNDF
jgi:hypothetical protein